MKKNTEILFDRDVLLSIFNEKDTVKIAKIGRALSSGIRIKILCLLHQKTMHINEIAHKFDLPISSTTFHLRQLEEADLIIMDRVGGQRGKKTISYSIVDSICVNASIQENNNGLQNFSIEMPIGNFFDCQITPPCGLAGMQGMIASYDKINSFYSPKRMEAQLIWFKSGFIEYRFPNTHPCILANTIKSIDFSVELCSEISGYHDVWPSDISIYVNDHFLCQYQSPGDFGSRRGKLTPTLWKEGSTQYGLLKTFSIKQDGIYIDELFQHSDFTISSFDISKYPYISFKIGVHENAKYCGGVNIFGEKYGDYPQGIIMNLIY